mmetsp:Transcript_33357/g.70119  ORF Transcript_33357/g.70119 Transcript_33357/m.70119 type:complete len:326 (+) Transcript_33357:418-1395(+)
MSTSSLGTITSAAAPCFSSCCVDSVGNSSTVSATLFCVDNLSEVAASESLPELTDMLLSSLPSTSAVADGRLKRVPSASTKENVPLGESPFFLGDATVLMVPAPLYLLGDVLVPCFGDFTRVGERLGEISPSGERTGDFDFMGLRLGDNVDDERLGDRERDLVLVGLFLGDNPRRLVGDLDFSLTGDSFFGEKLLDILSRIGEKLALCLHIFGEKLFEDRPWIGDKLLPLPLPPPIDDLAPLSTALLLNEFSKDERMGLQLSPNKDSSPLVTSIPLDDDEEMCDSFKELDRRRPPREATEATLRDDGRDKRVLPFERMVPRLLFT